jgi:hypothetical protein
MPSSYPIMVIFVMPVLDPMSQLEMLLTEPITIAYGWQYRSSVHGILSSLFSFFKCYFLFTSYVLVKKATIPCCKSARCWTTKSASGKSTTMIRRIASKPRDSRTRSLVSDKQKRFRPGGPCSGTLRRDLAQSVPKPEEIFSRRLMSFESSSGSGHLGHQDGCGTTC